MSRTLKEAAELLERLGGRIFHAREERDIDIGEAADGVLGRLAQSDWFARAAGLAFLRGGRGGALGLEELRGTELRRLRVGNPLSREVLPPGAFAAPELASVRDVTLHGIPAAVLSRTPLAESVEVLAVEAWRGTAGAGRVELPALRSHTVSNGTPEAALGAAPVPSNLSELSVSLAGIDDEARSLARWTRATPLRLLLLHRCAGLTADLLEEVLPIGLSDLSLGGRPSAWAGLPGRVAGARATLRRLHLPLMALGPEDLRALGDSPALANLRRLSLTLDGDPLAIGRAWRESCRGWALEELFVRLTGDLRGRPALADFERWLPPDAPAVSGLRRLTLANVELEGEDLVRLASSFPLETLGAHALSGDLAAFAARLPARLRCLRLPGDLRKRRWDGWDWRPPMLVRTG